MIPLSLQLKNFLSYGSTVQEIIFEPYHLICLSGKNGHGKSALFDAITWAIWGHARKITSASRADDNLLRLGQTHMMVICTFRCNGNTYRVKREYSKQGTKALCALEFGVLEKESNHYHSLTDKTVRQTQQRIDETIKFSFESFTNSVFLRQSQANEFSKKSPKERKEVLAAILGLEQYELLRRQALEKIRAATTHYQTFCVMHEKETQECIPLSQTPTLLNALLFDLAQTEKEIFAFQVRKKEWDALMHDQETKKKNAHSLLQQIQQMQQDTDSAKKNLSINIKEWRSSRNKTSQKTKEEHHKESMILVQEISMHQTCLQQSLNLKQQLLALKQEAAQTELRMQQEKSTALKEIEIMLDRLMVEKISLEVAQCAKKEEEKQLSDDLLRIEQIIEQHEKEITAKQETCPTTNQITKLEQYLEKGKATYQQWIARYSMLQTQITQLTQRKDLCANQQDPSCPLCEQNVSLSRRRFLQQKITTQHNRLIHSAHRIKNVIPCLKQKLLDLHSQYRILQEKIMHQESLKKEYAQLTLQRNDIKQNISISLMQHHETTERIILVTQAIEQHKEIINAANKSQQSYELPIYTHINNIEKELSNTLYNETAHAQAIEKHNRLCAQLTQIEQFELISATRKKQASLIYQECARIKKVIHTCILMQKELIKLENEIKKNNILASQAPLFETEWHTLNTKLSELFTTKGILEERVQLFEQKKKELARLEKQIKEYQCTIKDYQMIAQALSKDGIQALLIEEAIPELEAEANALLARLTNNSAHLFIESLKDLKKGGSKETLDITISDQAGIRPYELFSGGEAFRIDFALRIAISKLLARRAGTTLQTLIIDEGFGSQDEEGLAAIMDVIYAIQDEFAKIIIISHLPILKDQFPVHFVVEKRPQGSSVHVVQQG